MWPMADVVSNRVVGSNGFGIWQERIHSVIRQAQQLVEFVGWKDKKWPAAELRQNERLVVSGELSSRFSDALDLDGG